MTPHDPSSASVSASLTQAVLRASQLDAGRLTDPDARIPFSAQEALWGTIHTCLEHPEPGLAIGRALAPGQFSVLGYLLQSSPTLGEALEAELRYQRLVGEGSSYQQLLNDTRCHLAERHLQEGRLPIADIAVLLGYSEPSVFFRAFRQWTGLTPGEYRQKHRD